MPYKSEWDRHQAAAKYARSKKGRKKAAAWRKTAKGRKCQYRQNHSEMGVARRARYEATEKRRMYRVAWNWRSRKASRAHLSIREVIRMLVML